MSHINFNRSPFLAAALDYIRENPGCTKKSVAHYDGPKQPSRTVGYRYRAINRLIEGKLVRNYARAGRYHLLAIDGPRIAEYELLNHGIYLPDYFPGCGVAFTQFSHVVTGIGANPAEAIGDCIEQIAEGGLCDRQDWQEFNSRMLRDEKRRAWPKRPAAVGEAYYYVSIRFNVER